MSDRRPFGQRSDGDAEQHIETFLEKMTLEEKVGQVIGTSPHKDIEQLKSEIQDYHIGSVHFGGTPHNTPEKKAQVANAAQQVAVEESRLGIPLFLRAMAEHGHAAIAGSTVFSQQLGLAATRNPDIVKRSAATAATEMRATGVHSTSSPIGDVARDQRWGRIAETFGESPYLSARMTEAMVHGYQGNNGDLSADDAVLAVTKHFPMYSEGLRGEDQAPNEVSDYTMRRVHLPPYEAGIEAGTAGIMPCYNSINGEPVHGSKRFLTDLLRKDLGFDGFVLADAGGAEDLHNGHHATNSREESIWLSIRAGMDILPFGGPEYAKLIVGLVKDGELSEERIEESARRVLQAKYALGLFEDPYVEDTVAILGCDEHRQVARQAARESMTLLKNDDDVLPLSPDLGEVLVTGPNADNIAYQHGGWGNVQDPDPLGDTVLDGIESTVSSGTTVTYEPGVDVNKEVDVDAAVNVAKRADVAIVVLGEPDYVHEFKGSTDDFGLDDFPNRWELALPDAQLDLISAIQETGTQTVAVFVTGRVLATPWIAEHVPAILMAYQPGSEGGAVADVLFGKYNPHGKLPISIPRSVGKVPTRFNYLTHPMEGDDQQPVSYDPLFAYGHGLSYTEFEYKNLELFEREVGPSDMVDVEVTVTNTGERAGIETVELFVNDVLSSRVTPVRELKGFTRIELDAGEHETVRFRLDIEEMGIVQDDGTRTVEPGTFEVIVDELVEEFKVTRRRPFMA